MAKDKERKFAKTLFLQGKTQKEVAKLVGVQEKTVNTWCNAYNWKEERNARYNGGKERVEMLKELIGKLTEERLSIMRDYQDAVKYNEAKKVTELNKKAVSIADEVSKYNKALENLDSENRISLSVYLEVMDSIFKALEADNPKLFINLIDFQEKHISEIANKY